MPRLVIVNGPSRGQEYELKRETFLGADLENHMVLSGAGVAERHARIIEDAEEEAYFVESSSRTDTVLLNGEPIKDHARLSDGDRIQIGEVVIDYNPFGVRTRQGVDQLLGGTSRRPSVGIIVPLILTVVVLETIFAVSQKTAALLGGLLAAIILVGYLVKVSLEEHRKQP